MMALALIWPVAAPILIFVLLLAAVLGVSVTDQRQTQPQPASDSKVDKYFPGDWQKILKNAADRAAAGEPDYAIVPWTVLAGIVRVQTDFARYSPYDNVDRDPGRRSAEISAGSATPGGGPDDTGVNDASGAGPGPISGVSGSGESASLSPDHPGPPEGDLSHQLGWFMWAIRMHESHGDYTIDNHMGACGAYQYTSTTWNHYEGYPTACVAPPSVQDKRARADFLGYWRTYHTWQQVAASHFYPKWAVSPSTWNQCPANCDNSTPVKNPTIWGYVDDIMTKMREISARYPATTAAPAVSDGGPRGGARRGPGFIAADLSGVTAVGGRAAETLDRMGSVTQAASHVVAEAPDDSGCDVHPEPAIGGQGTQGSGPYLLTPAAAADMRSQNLDPQNPCESSRYVARKLADAAKNVHSDPSSPRWKPNGKDEDMANARKYWTKAIEVSGIFMDRTADPDAPCAVPPPEDPQKPWSVSFKIISIWRCETARMPELYLVTGGHYVNDKLEYDVEQDRSAATETLVDEALSVSYAASGWKTDQCDDKADSRQGIFPMTQQEAAAAGVTDRCDTEKNIDGAARLVLSVEKVPPEQRDHTLGVFQPMVGGWQKLGIAVGTELNTFSKAGPSRTSTSDACTDVMNRFLREIAPYASAFATLDDPPKRDDLPRWRRQLSDLEAAHHMTDPAGTAACLTGGQSAAFSAQLAQLAAGLAGDQPDDAQNLNGLGNYYQAEEDARKPEDPVPGHDMLALPRLASRPLNPIDAPVEPDAADSYSAHTGGTNLPLAQVAVDYAWFFGGVIAPFDSAGKRIGSLANGGGGADPNAPSQVTVGPDGCPEDPAPNIGQTLLDGSAKIGVHRLCVDSVAQARTPQAAMAIKWALSSLNWPYTQNIPARTTGRSADCSSFVGRAYRDSGAIPNLFKGNAPITTTYRVVPWVHQIPFGQVKPGDLVEPESGHVVMHLADGYNVQESTWGTVSRVRREYTSAFWAGWVDAGKI